MNKVHNLDENIRESFDFVVKGHTYSFKQLNTEEMSEMRSLKGGDGLLEKFLYKFITPIDDKSPQFSDIAKKMISPQWTKFTEMVEAEFKG